MKPNPLKRALGRGELTYGCWVSLAHPWATRMLARSGFDWLTVDLEHAPIGWNEAAEMFAIIADNSCVPLARVPAGNHDHIKRALDSGAWGVIVPMVDTVEQASLVVRAAKYPPQGNRSTGGGLHASSFDTTTSDYYDSANDEIVVVVQVESLTGVANLEAICAVDGVDAVFIGPNDLRRFMFDANGTPPSSEAFEEVVATILSTCQRAGTSCGILAADGSAARARAAQGMVLVGVSSDILLLASKAGELVGELYPKPTT